MIEWTHSAGYSAPETILYEVPRYRRITTSQTEQAVNGSDSNVYNVSIRRETGIPEEILVCVKKQGVEYDPISPEITLPIKRFGAGMNGNPQQFISIDNPQTLFDIGRKNGSQLPPYAFKADKLKSDINFYGTGSYMLFKPSDMGLSLGEQSNVNDTFNLDLSITVGNPYGSNMDVDVIVWLKYADVLVKNGASYTLGKGLIDKYKVLQQLESPEFKPHFESLSMYDHVMGGKRFNLGKALRRGWNKFKHWAKSDVAKDLSHTVRNLPVLNSYVGDNSAVGKLAQAYGYGGASWLSRQN